VLGRVRPDADPDDVRRSSLDQAVARYAAMLDEPDRTRLSRRAVHRLWDARLRLDPTRKPVRP
jgi:hypothetical protein